MKRLTNQDHKALGFCGYAGPLNPYQKPLLIGELAGSPADVRAAERPDGWISVEDRFPLDGEEVLVVVSGEHKNSSFQRAVEFAAHYASEGWVLDHYPEWAGASVTHWRPLPAPPKEAEP